MQGRKAFEGVKMMKKRKSTKRIEESATTALKLALLKCPILETYIDSNDKTPSWDGTVFVYKSDNPKKENLRGRVPIQVKGTENEFVSDIATFSCSTVDLNNYYRDGGCVFFLVSVEPSTGKHKIFYASLLVVDLNNILKNAKGKKTYSIHLKLFPENDSKEMAHIFLSFVSNAHKQAGFIGKELLSIEELEKRGTKIEGFTFNTVGIGLNAEDLPSFISTHDFYLYAKPQGLDIEIPVERVSNAIITKTVHGKIKIKEQTYFDSYSVQYCQGKPTIKIGKSISVVLTQGEKTFSVSVHPSGTLTECIKDTSFFLDMLENREVNINGATISFEEPMTIDVASWRKKLTYYKDVKKMLGLLGVIEELKVDAITPKDSANIKNLVSAVLYNRKIGFQNIKENNIYGPMKIANLVIWIWAKQSGEGLYTVENFFLPHEIAMFASDDIAKKHPIPASQFLLFEKSDFIHTSNLNYEVMYEDIIQKELKPVAVERYILWLLEILRAYDEQEQKDPLLLNFAEKVCDWLQSKDLSDVEILLLNKMQITKRQRHLKPSEIVELAKLTSPTCPPNIRCGAYLLLEDMDSAQKCFDELDKDTQKSFLTYPICHFGKPTLSKDTANL